MNRPHASSPNCKPLVRDGRTKAGKYYAEKLTTTMGRKFTRAWRWRVCHDSWHNSWV